VCPWASAQTQHTVGPKYSRKVKSQTWGVASVFPALGRLRSEDHEFKASLGYRVSSRLACSHSEMLPQKTNKD
jgi:hypothetical protein